MFGYGQQRPSNATHPVNVAEFHMRQIIARISTMKLVQVMAVHGGGIAPAGTVDVLPLVNQLDGNGNATAHGTVYGIPWSRVQGGDSAIICDPAVDDIGYVVAADRDISSVKNSLKRSNPGSFRRFDIADGIYAGGCLNAAPGQYLIFTSTGARLVDRNGNSIVMSATGMTISDPNGNEIIMGPGSINMVTPSFQVNGTPIVVP